MNPQAEDHPNPNASVTANVALTVSGYRLQMQLTVPTGPTRPVKLLPIFQSLADAVVGIAVRQAEAEGLAVSCRKGCGACCRQLVPLTAVEARRLVELVAEMPEPRRAELRARFAAARDALEEAGLLEDLLAPERIAKEAAPALGLKYFARGIACPFLEEESCSIHADRPVACREYLVTSPAAHCAQPTAETVKCVKIAGQVSSAIASLEARAGAANWVPLILAPEWAEASPEEVPARPGTELVQEVFSRLTGQAINSESSPAAITRPK